MEEELPGMPAMSPAWTGGEEGVGADFFDFVADFMYYTLLRNFGFPAYAIQYDGVWPRGGNP